VLHAGEFGLRDAVIGLSQAFTDGGGAGLDESANKILKKQDSKALNIRSCKYGYTRPQK
jgi:hypothetical protein